MNTHNDFLDNAVNDELETEGIENLTTDVCLYMQSDTEKICLFLKNDTCGGCGVDTKERYLEILEFTHFVTFFSFNKIGENHKEKILVKKVTVVVALDLGCGNTKNSEYESE